MAAVTLPDGVKVGHWTDPVARTGCTVVLCEAGAVASVDVRGGAPGTRDTYLLDPARTVQEIHAVLLTGGSAFGLDAAGGVLRWLARRGVGFRIRDVVVPICPTAVVFDLAVGQPTAPDQASGEAACEAATRQPDEGAVGAGTGSTVAKVLGGSVAGGVGIATVGTDLARVTAIVVVNAVGGIWDDERHEWVAEPRPGPTPPAPGSNTTIGAVVTNALLTKAQAQRLASVAHDGLARAVRPAHTDLDGDTLFALSVGGDRRVALDLAGMARLQVAAATAVSRAILRGVRAARGETMER